ncbi:MAG: DUF4214 domain-containing protein, partial [Planctomycetota bacterium]|nr:DUF4214 domain-containing protein [Planctomycetota bacterium]
QTLAVESYYSEFLDRDFDPEGLANFVSAAQLGVSDERLIAGFISSWEYSGRSDTNSLDYVDLMYATILHRSGDGDGIAAHLAALEAGASDYDVALGFLHSREFYTNAVAAAYEGLLDRDGAPEELSAWAELLVQGKLSLPQMRAAIAGSNEGVGVLRKIMPPIPGSEGCNMTSNIWQSISVTDFQGLTGGPHVAAPATREYVDMTTLAVVYVDASLLRTDLGTPGKFQFPASAIGGQASFEFLPGYYDHHEYDYTDDREYPLQPVDSQIASVPYTGEEVLAANQLDNPFFEGRDVSSAYAGMQYDKFQIGVSTWEEVYPLSEHVPYPRAEEIVDEATIHPEDILRIQPVPPVSQWTRLFDFVERKDLPQVPLNPSAPGPVTGFSLFGGEEEGSLLAKWDPSPGLGAHAVYTVTVTGGSVVQKFLTGGTSIEIEGLHAAVAYTFAVSASNDQYTGPKVEETLTTAACTRRCEDVNWFL